MKAAVHCSEQFAVGLFKFLWDGIPRFCVEFFFYLKVNRHFYRTGIRAHEGILKVHLDLTCYLIWENKRKALSLKISAKFLSLKCQCSIWAISEDGYQSLKIINFPVSSVKTAKSKQKWFIEFLSLSPITAINVFINIQGNWKDKIM